jgi:hypothetical protein
MTYPLWHGTLKVHQIESGEKYKDTVRVSQSYFQRPHDQSPLIEKNRVYRMVVKGKSILVAMRGSYRSGIAMDQVTRGKLGIRAEEEYEFEFYRAGLFGEFLWAWKATEPAYRIATRLGAVSLFLGLIGVVLGAWSLALAFK